MPVLKNENRKKKFLNDIGKMISENNTFKRGSDKPDFIKNFKDTKAYFDKQKSPEAKALSGYIQNFINVYNNQLSSGTEKNNEFSYQMLIDIASMSDGFTKAYNQYVKDNKYTALKNNNVKMLSAMVQAAENMSHRVEMEERLETVEFVNKQADDESKRFRITNEKYKEFVTNCAADDVNFLDTEEQLKEYKQKYEESKKLCENLQQKKEQLANGSDSSADIAEAEECRKELMDIATKLTAANDKIKALNSLKTSLKYFKAESKEIGKQIAEYNHAIDDDNLDIAHAKEKIAEEQKNIVAGEKAKKRINELDNDELMLAFAVANSNLEDFNEARAIFSDLSKDVNVSELINKTSRSGLEVIAMSSYEKAKNIMLNALPDLADSFNKLENDPKYSIKNFFADNNDAIVEKLNEREKTLQEITDSEDYKEYLQCKDIVSLAQASENNIKSLNKSIKELNDDIEMKKDLIMNTKLNSGFGREVTDALGYAPKEHITEKELLEAMDKEIASSEATVKNLNNSNYKSSLISRMQAAEQRAEDKNLATVNKKLTSELAKFNKIGEKLQKLTTHAKTEKQLRENIKSVVESRKVVQNGLNGIKQINPCKEIYDRLNSIKDRFNLKTNNKMNAECKRMMDQLDVAIAEFNPEVEGNAYNHDKQMEALDKLKSFSKEYLTAKANQRIPKIFASEQRMLRISCAEEMESFSATAYDMVADVKSMNGEISYEQAISYSNRTADDNMTKRMTDLAVENAAAKTHNTGKLKGYQQERIQRQKAPETPSLNTLEQAKLE